MKVIIWHNPRCSKSRQTLALLQERVLTIEIRRYLDDPPDKSEIADVLALLTMDATSLLRKTEAEYKTLGLKDVEDERELIKAMATHPRLIERPVVIYGDKAALGRPPEAVLEILPT